MLNNWQVTLHIFWIAWIVQHVEFTSDITKWFYLYVFMVIFMIMIALRSIYISHTNTNRILVMYKITRIIMLLFMFIFSIQYLSVFHAMSIRKRVDGRLTIFLVSVKKRGGGEKTVGVLYVTYFGNYVDIATACVYLLRHMSGPTITLEYYMYLYM